MKNNYGIKVNYSTNPEAYFDDTQLTDQWQNDVYLYAKNLLLEKEYNYVLDVGCGSGYKLIKYFNDYKTIGVDLPKTVSFLKEKYPNKNWQSGFEQPINDCDILIASDVIEHIANPELLLDYIKKCKPKEIILSTPERNLLCDTFKFNPDGPPHNKCHVREWNFEEFNEFISEHFEIIKHTIINTRECTQLIHAKIKDNV